MRQRFFKRLRTALLATACLASAMPAWASEGGIIEIGSFDCFLQGVNRKGCLTDCGGQCVRFCALINTCTGKFAGTAKGCVTNESCRKQCYKNVNFIRDCGVRVTCSIYTVEKKGSACYVATGCVEQRDSEL